MKVGMPPIGILFASAVLFSQLSYWGWLKVLLERPLSIQSLVETLLSLSAFILLYRPRSPAASRLLAASMLINIAYFLPEVPNHRLVLGFASLGILFSACFSRPASISTLSLDDSTSWRNYWWTLAVVVYFFAFFHKLNFEFIDTTTSCAVTFLGNISKPIATFKLVQIVSIWGTLILEAWFVVGLLFHATRKATVVAAMIFHLLLSFDMTMHFLDFSACMLLLLSSFVMAKPEAVSVSEAWIHRWTRATRVGFLLLVLAGLLWGQSEFGYKLFSYLRQVFWLAYAAAIVWWIVKCGAAARLTAKPPLLVFSCFLGMIVLNGLSPYLGFKTRTAFAMYSNLRLDQESSNHLLVPRSLDLLDLIADRATISKPDSGESSVFEIPYCTLERFLETTKTEEMFIQYHSRHYHFPESSPEPRCSWVIKKFTHFQPIGESVKGSCIW